VRPNHPQTLVSGRSWVLNPVVATISEDTCVSIKDELGMVVRRQSWGYYGSQKIMTSQKGVAVVRASITSKVRI
jgi:hypothetical protein